MRAFACGLLSGALLIPSVALIVLLLGGFPVPATSVPPRWEASIVRRAFAASVARQAQKLQNPVPPNSAGTRGTWLGQIVAQALQAPYAVPAIPTNSDNVDQSFR